jgi:hypothetical protein
MNQQKSSKKKRLGAILPKQGTRFYSAIGIRDEIKILIHYGIKDIALAYFNHIQ